MKAGTGLVWLYSQGAGLVGQLWLATGLVQGMWSGHRLLSHLLLSSSVSAGDCDMWGLLVASTELAGLVLDLWEVQLWCRHFSNTVPASEGAGWQTDFHGRRGVGLNSWMVQLPGSWRGGRRDQLEPVWLRAKLGIEVPLSQLSGAPPWEEDKLVGMLQPRHEVRRRQRVRGNFFVAQGNLGEILFILICCSCGWAEGRL